MSCQCWGVQETPLHCTGPAWLRAVHPGRPLLLGCWQPRLRMVVKKAMKRLWRWLLQIPHKPVFRPPVLALCAGRTDCAWQLAAQGYLFLPFLYVQMPPLTKLSTRCPCTVWGQAAFLFPLAPAVLKGDSLCCHRGWGGHRAVPAVSRTSNSLCSLPQL